MRDPERIDEFCKVLAEAWHKVPDWRFGQLFMNIPFRSNPWFIEDDEMLAIIRERFGVPAEDTREPIAPDEVARAIGDGTIRIVRGEGREDGMSCEICGRTIRLEDAGGWASGGPTPAGHDSEPDMEDVTWGICEALLDLQYDPDGQEDWMLLATAIRGGEETDR